MNPPTEPTERPETVEPEPRHGRGRSFAKRLGAVLGPLFLFVGLPVALRALFERVSISEFDVIGQFGLVLGISAMVGLLAAGRLRGWYLPGVKELLVALAIVVLSYIVVPEFLVREQIEQGSQARMRNNGRMVVEQILAADAERTGRGEPSVWPSAGKYDSANAYLSKLMAKGALSGVSTSMFAGGGVEAAADARDLERHGSAWSVLAGAGGAHPATPVLWTRNLRGLRPEDFAGADPKRPRPWGDRLAPEERPFGDLLVVLVRRDGRAETIRARDLTDAAFLGGATNDPAALEVLEALADEIHAESAESELHAESAEDTESEAHAESAEEAKKGTP
jgi:hypothetical protein